MPVRDTLRYHLGRAAQDVLRALGASVTWTNKANAAITLDAAPGPLTKELMVLGNMQVEEEARPFFIPSQAGLLAQITTKALTTDVATITTRLAHELVTGLQVYIRLDTADAVFDGYQIITTVPTTTTFTFAKVNADVTSVAATGYARTIINIGDRITFESVTYEIRRVGNADGLWAGYELETVREQAVKIGVG